MALSDAPPYHFHPLPGVPNAKWNLNAGVQRPNQQVEELVALFDAQTRRRVAAARRAHGARTQRFGLLQRVRPGVASSQIITQRHQPRSCISDHASFDTGC